jgi:hypothetical protein
VESQCALGWVLISEPFDDEGYSGATLDRPALDRLVALVNRGLVDQVIVHRLDRLSRSVRDCSKLLHDFRRLDVGLVVATAPELGYSAQDSFMLNNTYQMQKQQKTEKVKWVEAFLPDSLKVAIDQCEWLSKTLPFAFGSSKNPSYLANEVYERMKTVGLRCGVADCRPHRLRDTRAVRWLLQGLQVGDVNRLLGHSSVRVTELYYSKWISSRKTRLERLLSET